MDDGCLCDSILKTAARPSPLSPAPAFSPGPCSTRGPWVVSVCAWCERFLGIKEPKSDSTITHGICRTCFARQTWTETPVLVVSRERQHLVPILEEMMRGIPEIRLVVDRRRQDRRQQAADG